MFSVLPCYPVPPKIRPFSFGDEIYAGEGAEIQCSANGDIPMKITWTFHGFGTALNAMKGVQIHKTGQKSSVLGIEGLTAENSGNYTVCKKWN